MKNSQVTSIIRKYKISWMAIPHWVYCSLDGNKSSVLFSAIFEMFEHTSKDAATPTIPSRPWKTNWSNWTNLSGWKDLLFVFPSICRLLMVIHEGSWIQTWRWWNHSTDFLLPDGLYSWQVLEFTGLGKKKNDMADRRMTETCMLSTAYHVVMSGYVMFGGFVSDR